MEKFSLEEYQFFAEAIHIGTIEKGEKLLPPLYSIIKKCEFNIKDTFIDRIFKVYLQKHNINKVYETFNTNKCIKSRQTIIDIIVFKQSTYQDINILAKVLYRKHGEKEHKFLDWQIDKLLSGAMLDMKQEYIDFRNANQYVHFYIHPMIDEEIECDIKFW